VPAAPVIKDQVITIWDNEASYIYLTLNRKPSKGRSFTNGEFRGVLPRKDPLTGELGVSPKSKSPQEWGIKGVDVDYFSNLINQSIDICDYDR